MSQQVAESETTGAALRIGAFVLAAVGLFFGLKWWIGQSTVKDAVDRYEIAVRSGNQADACHQAELVASAQLYAKQEDDWRRWNDIANRACLTVRR